ncbi:hypothetical protein LSAT2_025799 [Lamellibrachia satsuma]|nr:hypothetical protein LSAT2_025799 [Lamellibrachia satsuma]
MTFSQFHVCLQKDLVGTGVATETKARETINKLCLPLVGERQAIFEKLLENMDAELELHNSQMLVEMRALFKFCQGAAHIWDVHELGLAKQERALHERLDECRHQHDNENQELEAELDIVMDRMRQEASEKNLNESLTKGLAMLDKIKEGYELFHTVQTDIVAEYPHMVHEELTRYDESVCIFFTVNRNLPPVEKHKSQVSMKPSRSKGSKEKLSKERLSQERLASQQDLPEEKTAKQDEDTNKKPIQQQELIEDEPGREDVADEVKTEEIDGEVSAKSSKKKLDQMPSETSRFDVAVHGLEPKAGGQPSHFIKIGCNLPPSRKLEVGVFQVTH